MKPVIGITLDQEKAGGYAKHYPWYALRTHYSDAVAELGGIPFHLPYHKDLAAEYLERIDGLILTGGDFDIDPLLYGAAHKHEATITNSPRTDFEIAVTKIALERGMPILGICAGEQLLNVLLGGTLVQHIPD